MTMTRTDVQVNTHRLGKVTKVTEYKYGDKTFAKNISLLEKFINDTSEPFKHKLMFFPTRTCHYYDIALE